MSDWITDRLPTIDDELLDGRVFTMFAGSVVTSLYFAVQPGQPWQPIPRPAPYVKPKRWTVMGDEINNTVALAEFGQWRFELCDLTPKHYNAAQRICDIYNEVMP